MPWGHTGGSTTQWSEGKGRGLGRREVPSVCAWRGESREKSGGQMGGDASLLFIPVEKQSGEDVLSMRQ